MLFSKRLVGGSLCAALALAMLLSLTTAQQPEMLNAVPKQDTTILMRAKLASSQKVVEGLMAGDFEMIEKGASDLEKICDSANWRHHEDQVVTHYRSELRRGAVKMAIQAEDKNLEGAAYVYMHTLTTCINCHEYARNVLRIAHGIPGGAVVPIPTSEQEAEAYRRSGNFR